MMDIGKAIKMHRTVRGWTQKDMAKSLDVTETYISLLECGARSPSLALLCLMCRYFGIPLSNLIRYAEDLDRGAVYLPEGP